MKFKSKIVWKALAYAISLLVVLALLGSIPYLQIFAFLWLPGALFAALFFPEGIHSDFAITYMIAAALIDVTLYAIPIYIYLLMRSRKAQSRVE
jgi:hypothetical protein